MPTYALRNVNHRDIKLAKEVAFQRGTTLDRILRQVIADTAMAHPEAPRVWTRDPTIAPIAPIDTSNGTA